MQKERVIELTAEQKAALEKELAFEFDELAVRVDYAKVPQAVTQGGDQVVVPLAEAAGADSVWVVDKIKVAPAGGNSGFDLEQVTGGYGWDSGHQPYIVGRRRP